MFNWSHNFRLVCSFESNRNTGEISMSVNWKPFVASNEHSAAVDQGPIWLLWMPIGSNEFRWAVARYIIRIHLQFHLPPVLSLQIGKWSQWLISALRGGWKELVCVEFLTDYFDKWNFNPSQLHSSRWYQVRRNDVSVSALVATRPPLDFTPTFLVSEGMLTVP